MLAQTSIQHVQWDLFSSMAEILNTCCSLSLCLLCISISYCLQWGLTLNKHVEDRRLVMKKTPPQSGDQTANAAFKSLRLYNPMLTGE